MIFRKHHNYLVVVNDLGMKIDRILTSRMTANSRFPACMSSTRLVDEALITCTRTCAKVLILGRITASMLEIPRAMQ
jgi:hypothetical protein